MAKIKLTKTVVDAAQPQSTDVELRDTLVPQQIDAIEALDIDPASTSPAYWRTLGNRLSARLPLPAYTVERHAAYLAGEVLR